MKTLYKYSILSYEHSPFLSERVNIGVLIYFESTGELFFNYSKNLSRLKSIYNNVPERTIKEYLKQIDKRIKDLSNRNDFYRKIEIMDFDNYISENFLPLDGSSLRYNESKEGYQLSDDLDLFKNSILNKVFISDKVSKNYSKEPLLIKEFYSYLKSRIDIKNINSNSKLFFENYELENEVGTTFKFDFAWQNGTLNLVKPISFDLKDSKNISEKAYKNLGQFIDLNKVAKERSLSYDLLVGRPSDKKFYKAYDHALYLLEKIEHSRIVEEDQIYNYSQKAINALNDHQL